MVWRVRVLPVLGLLISLSVQAEYARSKAALRAFIKVQACPATGEHRFPCPGWQIDHIIPLKCLGLDEPENMQWLTVEDHKAKTKRESKECRK
jgi:5-methylcytosine-specific restriction endonuclease McrA